MQKNTNKGMVPSKKPRRRLILEEMDLVEHRTLEMNVKTQRIHELLLGEVSVDDENEEETGIVGGGFLGRLENYSSNLTRVLKRTGKLLDDVLNELDYKNM